MQGLQELLQDSLRKCVEEIKARHIAAGQMATGKTARALEWRLRIEGSRYIGEILGRPYTGALETGSRPARRRGTEAERQAFVQSLTEWCRVRGFPASGLTDDEYKRAANWLSWYIKKHGTSLYRKGGRRDIITPAIDALRATVEERLQLYYSELMAASFDNQFFTEKS